MQNYRIVNVFRVDSCYYLLCFVLLFAPYSSELEGFFPPSKYICIYICSQTTGVTQRDANHGMVTMKIV